MLLVAYRYSQQYIKLTLTLTFWDGEGFETISRSANLTKSWNVGGTYSVSEGVITKIDGTVDLQKIAEAKGSDEYEYFVGTEGMKVLMSELGEMI